MEPLSSWSSAGTWATFPRGDYRQDYRGVQLQKCEQDLERYRELIEVSQPDLVIETGSRDGGSALWFRDEMKLQVVSIDIVKPDTTKLPGHDRFTKYPGIEFLSGSSVADWVFETLLKLVRGKRVMVSLDSDHHAPHVIQEIDRLAPLVSPGCYLVVEDACFDIWGRTGMPDEARVGGSRIPEVGGPLRAIEATLDSGAVAWSRFRRDESLEDLSRISHSPCGWWRRDD